MVREQGIFLRWAGQSRVCSTVSIRGFGRVRGLGGSLAMQRGSAVDRVQMRRVHTEVGSQARGFGSCHNQSFCSSFGAKITFILIQLKLI
jgi:hypothetical protein